MFEKAKSDLKDSETFKPKFYTIIYKRQIFNCFKRSFKALFNTYINYTVNF